MVAHDRWRLTRDRYSLTLTLLGFDELQETDWRTSRG